MPSNDLGYLSHAPVLAALLARTSGPVLELGCGWGSTPLLHAVCGSMKRPLNSYETDPAWLEQFKFLATPFHAFHRVESWGAVAFPGQYSVALIDCAPGEIRKDLALQLRESAVFIVLHDALSDGIHGGGGDYRYEKILGAFRFHAYYAVLRPASLVLSNFEDPGISAVEQERREVL